MKKNKIIVLLLVLLLFTSCRKHEQYYELSVSEDSILKISRSILNGRYNAEIKINGEVNGNGQIILNNQGLKQVFEVKKGIVKMNIGQSDIYSGAFEIIYKHNTINSGKLNIIVDFWVFRLPSP